MQARAQRCMHAARQSGRSDEFERAQARELIAHHLTRHGAMQCARCLFCSHKPPQLLVVIVVVCDECQIEHVALITRAAGGNVPDLHDWCAHSMLEKTRSRGKNPVIDSTLLRRSLRTLPPPAGPEIVSV